MSKRQITPPIEQEAMARKIWLAGLGAYAKSAKEVTNLSERGRTWFEELMERGRELENQTKTQVKDAASQTQQAMTQQINARVQRFTGLDPHQLDELDNKLDQLTDVVDKLAAAKAAPAAPAAEVKAEAKPAPRRTTRKPAAKKDA
ncbi:phasin family protein [Ferrimonas balearica]|uniref:phasin family protein n=1 Tax=Ferrimonas balearica TaxID=44012 RepID=UPI001C58ECEC|nr:phasin family protein [Ferrimonas balearica]MBW3165263.1 phasin family protein [Ferrimonas balearica]